jgi:hypothetical protein
MDGQQDVQEPGRTAAEAIAPKAPKIANWPLTAIPAAVSVFPTPCPRVGRGGAGGGFGIDYLELAGAHTRYLEAGGTALRWVAHSRCRWLRVVHALSAVDALPYDEGAAVPCQCSHSVGAAWLVVGVQEEPLAQSAAAVPLGEQDEDAAVEQKWVLSAPPGP